MPKPSLQPHTSRVDLMVNNHRHNLVVAHHWTLLRVLREVLGLTGSKRGCDRGECGACTVVINRVPVNSCQILAIQARGKSILTIEGLATNQKLHPIQEAFLKEDSGQCGYCTPGFLMSAYALLQRNPAPTEQDIREALVGNLCRCNAYGRIMSGVVSACSALKKEQL